MPDGTVWTAEEKDTRRGMRLTKSRWRGAGGASATTVPADEDMFRQEYPACADEAFLTSGSAVFDNEIIIKRRETAPKPVMRGEFEFDYDGLTITNIRFAERENGYVSIYEKPKSHVPYVIGGDTAGEGSDHFAGQVLDNTDGHQTASLRHQFNEGHYARQMYCLGRYYNGALIGIETNYSTYPVKELERLRYPRLYVRQAEDTFTHKIRQSFGFVTNSVTRPVIIAAALVEIMRETPELVCDFITLGEMMTFVLRIAPPA